MSRRILILDDDSDFNNLLTDIYSQADYEVISEHDPENAIELFRGGDFDLVVTDQKMPGLSGEEFIQEIKQHDPHVPVIMVSGYLDNDTIRNLIRDGVGGVFLKPLNVFSLLKRTSALIEEAQSRLADMRGKPAEKDAEDFRHDLPFTFKSFPCYASRSREFAKRLYAMRNFKNNLVLIGEEGTDLPGLIEDFHHFDPQDSGSFALLNVSEVSQSLIEQHIHQSATNAKQMLTLVIPRADLLVPEQKQAIYAAGKQRGFFKDAPFAPRFIFFIHEDIDVLYDSKRIDDELYMFLGTSEVKLPRLKEIREDIPLIAQQTICAESKQLGSVHTPRLNAAARAFLKEREWPGGVLELNRVARAAVHMDTGDEITRDDMQKAALNVGRGQSDSEFNLRAALRQHRNEYLSAVYLLCGDEVHELLALDKLTCQKMLEPIKAQLPQFNS